MRFRAKHVVWWSWSRKSLALDGRKLHFNTASTFQECFMGEKSDRFRGDSGDDFLIWWMALLLPTQMSTSKTKQHLRTDLNHERIGGDAINKSTESPSMWSSEKIFAAADTNLLSGFLKTKNSTKLFHWLRKSFFIIRQQTINWFSSIFLFTHCRLCKCCAWITQRIQNILFVCAKKMREFRFDQTWRKFSNNF